MRISDAQGVLFFPVINLDLPTVKITLQQQLRFSLVVGTQKISGLAVVSFGIHRKLIWLRGYHQKTKPAGTRPFLPEHVIHLFVTDISPCASKVDPAFLPRDGIILTNRFGRKLFFAVFASANLRYREAQPGIFTTATDDFSTIQSFTKDGSIAQTSINGLQHLPVIFSQLLLS